MRYLAAAFSVVLERHALRDSLASRMRLIVERLLTLLVVLMAVGLALAYQLLRHLPASWRAQLAGDDVSAPE